jgi:hypothetical protein
VSPRLIALFIGLYCDAGCARPERPLKSFEGDIRIRHGFPSWPLMCLLFLSLCACGGGGGGHDDGNAQPPSPPTPPSTFTVEGSVSGLTGNGLVLRNNGGDALSISANGPFTFATPIATGAAYSVTIATQPSGQSCSLANQANTAGAAVSNVAVTCVAERVVTSIELSSDTSLMIADGRSSPKFEIVLKDQSGAEMPSVGDSIEIYVNGVPQAGSQFTTHSAGTYAIEAHAGSVASNRLFVNAREERVYSEVMLPVIFHVVHFGEATGEGSNFADSRINELMTLLNKGFANQLGSDDPNAVDTRVRFRLASLDPGDAMLAEPGIHRLDGTSYDVGGGVAQDVSGDRRFGPNESFRLEGDTFWDPRLYLNVWLMPLNIGGAGAASLPYVYADAPLDGLETVAVNCNCEPWRESFGSLHFNPQGGALGIVHEVGHHLGLLHPFSFGTCGPGDYVSDTYNYLFDHPELIACPGDGDQGLARSTTIMDYTGAVNTFTYGQSERIHHVLNYGLWIRELKNSTK